MKYELTAPCGNCPFLKEGGVRLTAGRIREIAGIFLGGGAGDFACHKTTIDCEEDDGGFGERRATEKSQHCAGALIFAEKHDRPTQMMRICERIGMYDRAKLKGHDLVFDDLGDMLETAVDRRPAKRRKAKKGRK